MVKKIAVYGSYMAKVPVKQRYWKRRKDGVKQRYWKTTKRKRKVEGRGRYEFSGRGRDLYTAVVKAHRFMPKTPVVEVAAEEFMQDPETYGYEGHWIDREVES